MNSAMSMRLAGSPQSAPSTVRARRGKFPKNVFLTIPHDNESCAVFGLQYSVSDRLEAKGVRTTGRNQINLTTKLWRMRCMLDRVFPDGSRDSLTGSMITALLTIKDLQMRLRKMSEFFSNYPEGAFMEFHATPEHILLGQGAEQEFSRIAGTDMFLCRDTLLSFSENLSIAREKEAEIESEIRSTLPRGSWASARERLQQIKSRIEAFFDFFSSQAEKECAGILSGLKGKEGRILILEVPAERGGLMPAHSMHKRYFEPSLSGEGFALRQCSDFESTYAAYIMGERPFSRKEEDALLNQLRLD